MEASWLAWKDVIGLRSTICGRIYEGVVLSSQNQAGGYYCLSSTRQWTDGMGQSVVGTVPLCICQPATTTGMNFFCLQNSNTTIMFIPLHIKFHSCWTLGRFLRCDLNDNATHIWRASMSSKIGWRRLDEVKAALTKSKYNMARYYDQRCTPAPNYQPGDKVYLNASDIQTTWPSKKLSHCHLGPFEIVKEIGNGAYCLKLTWSMSCLHPVFNVIKLTLAPPDPILGHHLRPLLPLEIVDGEEEWIVEEILDSKVINQKLQYLVKWEGFRIKHNSWEPWDNIHAPNLIAEFHWKHPGVACQVKAIDFTTVRVTAVWLAETSRRSYGNLLAQIITIISTPSRGS